MAHFSTDNPLSGCFVPQDAEGMPCEAVYAICPGHEAPSSTWPRAVLPQNRPRAPQASWHWAVATGHPLCGVATTDEGLTTVEGHVTCPSCEHLLALRAEILDADPTGSAQAPQEAPGAIQGGWKTSRIRPPLALPSEPLLGRDRGIPAMATLSHLLPSGDTVALTVHGTTVEAVLAQVARAFVHLHDLDAIGA